MQTPLKTQSLLKKVWNSIVSLATNQFFALGLLALILLLGAGYLLVDRVVMPSYARHNVSVTVPDVKELPIEEAKMKLEAMDLQTEVESGRYNPSLPRNIVVDQNPQPDMFVKPGRRVYLTINTGSTPEVAVPSLEGINRSEAENRLFAAGLKSEMRRDSIPHRNPDLVTRQYPAAGAIVEEGSSVRIWYSTGLGKNYVTVPSVRGLSAREAKRLLLSMKLRSLILGAGDYPDPLELIVNSQSHAEGTRLKEGYEIRLFVKPGEENEN